MLILVKDKAYRDVEAGPWRGWEPVDIMEANALWHRWDGWKVPIFGERQMWHEITSFFEWAYKETHSESMVHLFYHEEEGWEAMVLPQKGRGLSVEVIEDHPNRVPTFSRLGRGWECRGTVHNHCSSSAFQSGTDSHDEKTKEGLHITVGGIGSNAYSIHARTSFRKEILDAKLSDWFEIPEAALEVLPEDLHDQCVTSMLKKPNDVEFPEWWKENVVKESSIIIPSHAAGMGFGWSQGSAQQNAPAIRSASTQWFEYGLEELLRTTNCTAKDLHTNLLMIESEDVLKQFMELISDNHVSFAFAIRVLADMLKEEAKEENFYYP